MGKGCIEAIYGLMGWKGLGAQNQTLSFQTQMINKTLFSIAQVLLLV